ncbi:hypothetical protein PUR34_14760 [Streptomyces sp. JV185]|uniref:aromatic-ring hydroxylase C-terminal domain-containing protein n=1 Tax=Streptomyces sp. JV185 TaxID=858638 RepID=UPI002E77BF60|nr:hypothetical protein [Streptomyces sp. JV185]MEE1769374.1 hypothetical protein [Streptomyces sp. JV185]
MSGTPGPEPASSGQVLDHGFAFSRWIRPVSGYHPNGAPGHRAPHTRIRGPPGVTSTLDLIGPGFTLITAADTPAWQQQADAAAAAACIPVTVHRLDGGRLSQERPGTFHRLCALPATGAVLARPDGHIAWRAASPSAGPDLLHALRRILTAVR